MAHEQARLMDKLKWARDALEDMSLASVNVQLKIALEEMEELVKTTMMRELEAQAARAESEEVVRKLEVQLRSAANAGR